MRALLSWPGRGNPGDSVIRLGVEMLMKAAFTGIEFQHVPGWEQRPMVLIDWNADFLIFCGTPWLWDSCQQTAKYDTANYEIGEFKKASPKGKVLFLGIGEAFAIGYPREFPNKIESEGIKALFNKADLITARSTRAASILEKCGVKSRVMPCPALSSFYSPKNITRERAVIFHDPMTGLSHREFQKKPDQKNEFVRIQMQIAKEWNAEVATVTAAERMIAIQQGVREVTVLDDEIGIFLFLEKRPCVFSGRIHIAMAAASMGIPACVLASDSRAGCAGEWGIGVANDEKEAREWLYAHDPLAQHSEWMILLRGVGSV